jgi:thiol:disulfide interchange protein
VLAMTIPRMGKVWHVYSITQGPGGPLKTQINVGPPASFRLIGRVTGTEPDIANDPNFGIMTETYSDSAIFSIPASSMPTATGTKRLIISVQYQACTDTYCLPPVVDTVGVDVKLVGTPVELPAVSGSAAPPAIEAPRAVQPVVPIPTLPGNGSLALFLWIAATMGALSLLTPCVFPMVPITISYFSRGESRGRGQAVRDAAVYAAGIVVAFTSLGLGLAVVLGATGLNRFAANPWLNLAIAVLFAGFALSLFGVIHLAVPGKILTRIDALTRDSTLGRDGTTLLMGVTFALTSFTCTAPFVGTLLVSATQGNWKWPALGLLTFSTVFALPFLILALVPEALAKLPRSGEWMVTMKGALAFLELAAAIKFLSNADLVSGWGVVTRPVVLASWVALGLALTAWLSSRARNAREGSVVRRLAPATVTLVITAWLTTGLFGHRLGELEPFLPPAGTNSGGVANGNELSWIMNDYASAIAQGRAEHKLVLIDFTGYTCTNCRWMEANMFPRDEVRRELDRFVRVRLFTDGRDDNNAQQQAFEEAQFHTVALPLYAIVDANGETRGQFLGMTRNADAFVAFLAGRPADRK